MQLYYGDGTYISTTNKKKSNFSDLILIDDNFYNNISITIPMVNLKNKLFFLIIFIQQ